MIVLATFLRKLDKKQQMLLVGAGSVLSIFFVFLLSRAISELLFVVAEVLHLGGIGILITKLRGKHTAAGESAPPSLSLSPTKLTPSSSLQASL